MKESTILLLHGLGQREDSWAGVIRHLPGWSIRAPRLIEPEAKGETYGDCLARAERAMPQGEPLVLCGVSQGAILAMHLALGHPSPVRALVLVAPQVKMPRLLLRVQNGLFRCMPRRVFDKIGVTKESMMSICASMEALDFRERLSALSCPVHILLGEKDRANLPAARRMQGFLPQSRLTLVPGAGHEVNVDAPEALARCIDEACRALG